MKQIGTYAEMLLALQSLPETKLSSPINIKLSDPDDRLRMPGRFIVRLMRQHHVTIRDLAKRMRITMKRVREVRANGVCGPCMCLDWYQALTQTGIFSTKVPPMPSTTETQSVDTYSGHITLDGAHTRVDFQTPSNATQVELDAAFLAALAQIATIDYIKIGTSKS